jgi:hypothetical protein
MAICDDPKLTYLNNLGYSVLRYPRQGIAPLGIIAADCKKRDLMGTLDQIWKSSVAVPVPGPQLAAGNISGFRSSDLKISAGLDILANALNGMFGGSAPSVDVAYADAKSMQFQLGDVTTSGIDPFVIGDYITKGELASQNPFVRRYFTGQDGTRAYVISQVLLAKSLKVTAKRDDSTAVKVDVPAIQAAVGAKAGVTVSGSDSTEVTYSNPMPLVFGFQMFEVIYAGGRWDVRGVAPAAATAFSDESDADHDPVVADGELMEIGYTGF